MSGLASHEEGLLDPRDLSLQLLNEAACTCSFYLVFLLMERSEKEDKLFPLFQAGVMADSRGNADHVWSPLLWLFNR